MCEDCPPEVKELATRLAAYFNENAHVIVGGLHIVIEDENVSDEHIKWCQDNAKLDERSRQFAADLLAMPVPHRHMAIQLGWNPRLMEED